MQKKNNKETVIPLLFIIALAIGAIIELLPKTPMINTIIDNFFLAWLLLIYFLVVAVLALIVLRIISSFFPK